MDAWRKVLRRFAEQEVEGIALEAPEDLNDSTAGLVCPSCGELDVAVQEVEDSEVQPSVGLGGGEVEIIHIALCKQCGAEFSPNAQVESTAARTVISVLEARARRRRKKSSTLGILSRDEIRALARRS